jgi:glutamate 5-kinase
MRPALVTGDRLVVKVGTSSIVDATGHPDEARLARLCDGVVEAKACGVDVIIVSSGAIAAGLQPLGIGARPTDIPSLQAAAAVGQGRLLQHYAAMLLDRGLVCAQMLLTQHDFVHRQQYLNARNTLDRLLALGAVPVVNENDTVATDEIRFGDNDRLAALVGNLARAKLLALLTDARGLHAQDPRRFPDAPLLSEVERITPELEKAAGGSGSDLATGGMASKIAAAWVATFSGVGVVVASTEEASLDRLIAGEAVGTYFHPHPTRASARRLWIAFAQPPQGCVVVDAGARKAMVEDNRSLLAVGVVDVQGSFDAGATVDVKEGDKDVFARGLIRFDAKGLIEARGKPSAELAGREVIHRDELVILEGR